MVGVKLLVAIGVFLFILLPTLLIHNIWKNVKKEEERLSQERLQIFDNILKEMERFGPRNKE